MASKKTNTFDASGPMAGYLFQCRLALLLSLRRAKASPNSTVTIEKYDDIAFDGDDLGSELIQAKHSVNPKPISDFSTDFWKTMRVWIDDYRSMAIENASRSRILITTSPISSDSVLSSLDGSQDDDEITVVHAGLLKASKESTSKTSELGRLAFQSLPEADARAVLASITIIPGSSSLVDVKDDIEEELTLVSYLHREHIREKLEGWWFHAVASRLVGAAPAEIMLHNLVTKVNEIGQEYGVNSLPLSDPATLGTKLLGEEDEKETYVRQMRLIQLQERAVQRGVQDYYRAQAQRSKWVREQLLIDDDLAAYDKKLKDLWDRRIDAEYCDADSWSEAEKRLEGKKTFHWAAQSLIEFRGVVESWVTSGAFQGLSHSKAIGWHPDFFDLLAELDD